MDENGCSRSMIIRSSGSTAFLKVRKRSYLIPKTEREQQYRHVFHGDTSSGLQKVILRAVTSGVNTREMRRVRPNGREFCASEVSR